MNPRVPLRLQLGGMFHEHSAQDEPCGASASSGLSKCKMPLAWAKASFEVLVGVGSN